MTKETKKQELVKGQRPWTKKDMNIFLPYLYKMIRKSDPTLHKVLSNSELIEKYNTEPKFKEIADFNLNARIEKFAKNQSLKGVKGGAVSGEKRNEAGYFQSEFWRDICKLGRETQLKNGNGMFRPRTAEDGRFINKWQKENPEKVSEIGRKNIKKAQIGASEKYYGTETHVNNFASARKAANKKQECVHCGAMKAMSTINRWHNDNCYVNTMRHLYDALPKNTPMKKPEILEFLKHKGFKVDAKLITKLTYKHPWINITKGGSNGAPGLWVK